MPSANWLVEAAARRCQEETMKRKFQELPHDIGGNPNLLIGRCRRNPSQASFSFDTVGDANGKGH